MSVNLLFEGIGAALVTLFKPDNTPDADATAQHAMSLVKLGCRAILLAGTAGESWKLSAQDRVVLARALREYNPGVPIIVGTGDRSAARALDITRAVAAAGVADALLVLSPSDQAAPEFYRSVAEESRATPVLAYHLPLLSPPGVPLSALEALPIAGIKDSSGDADRLTTMLVGHEIPVYVGSPNLLMLAGRCGAAGALVALANTDFERCRKAWDGDPAAQRDLMNRHLASLNDFPAQLKPRSVVR